MPGYADIHSHVLQDVLARLDETYQAFFRRVANGEKPWFPRFHGKDRSHSFTDKEDGTGARLDNGYLVLSKIGRIAVRWSRPIQAIQGTIKTVTISKEANGWYVSFSCAKVPVEPLPRTVQSTPESGAQAGYDGHKRRKGAKVHLAVDTLGHLLTAVVTPASEQERAQVADLAEQVQAVTGDSVGLAYVDQGYTGTEPAEAAATYGIQLEVVKLPEAQGPRQGFVLLPKRWVVERSFAWLARFRRLARDYERLPQTVAGVTLLGSTCLRLSQVIHWPLSS